MKRESFFMPLRKGGWEKTTGYPFTMSKLPGIVWFVHGKHYGKLCWWKVSEKSTGLCIGIKGFKTRKNAIESARKKIKETSLDCCMSAIRDSVKVPQELWDSLLAE